MSIEQINSAAFDYDIMLATIEGAYIGKADITISEYDSTAAPDVKVGSKFEVNGALFKVLTADETPSGYAGISNSTTFYIMYDVSGEEFVFTSVAPTWNDALQGWYESGQTDRYFFFMRKDSGGTLYTAKQLLKRPGEKYTIVLDIGDWDMSNATGSGSVNVIHGLTYSKIRSIDVIIRNDADTLKLPLNFALTVSSGFFSLTSTTVDLTPVIGGVFDGTDYNATSYNRGWITIAYEL